MWTALFALSIVSVGLAATQNRSASRNVDFGIEELLLLNRHFLDFLIAYDGSLIVQSEDVNCLGAMQQLSTAYLARDRHGLECKLRRSLIVRITAFNDLFAKRRVRLLGENPLRNIPRQRLCAGKLGSVPSVCLATHSGATLYLFGGVFE